MKFVFYPKRGPSCKTMVAELHLEPSPPRVSGLAHEDFARVALDVLTPCFTELWNIEAAGVVVPDTHHNFQPVNLAPVM